MMYDFKEKVPSSNSRLGLGLYDNNINNIFKNNSEVSKNKPQILKNVPPPSNNNNNGKSYKARSSPREARVKESPLKMKKEIKKKEVNKLFLQDSDSSILCSLYNTIKSTSLSKNNRTKDNISLNLIPKHIKTKLIIEKLVNYQKKKIFNSINELVREYLFSNKDNDDLDFNKEIFIISKGNSIWIQNDNDHDDVNKDKYKINFEIKSIFDLSISIDFYIPNLEQSWIISHHISDVSYFIKLN